MIISKVINLIAASGSKHQLGRLGRSVGDELPRQRMDILRKCRAEIAIALHKKDNDEYRNGYLNALKDVLTAFEASVVDEECKQFANARSLIAKLQKLSDDT